MLAVAGCTDFPGDVTVLRDGTDLAPLAGVLHIAGTLKIGGIEYGAQSMLTSLAALSDLESVGGLDLTQIDIP
ncbi:hypothetical protein M2T37_27660, partial [Klebsiella pneumoniae]|uniref:hypothetical protein n=1 Tax=Klebsiella pneumoniae TaxID=573 RepID=UPI00200DECCB